MRKIFLPLMIIGTLSGACAEATAAAQTATVAPTIIPALLITEPKLLTELRLETQTDTSYTLDWSPDGEMLAVGSGYEITLLHGDLQGSPTVLDPMGGALGVTWSPDQRQFATVNGFRDPEVRIWDWDSANKQLTRALEIQAGSDQYGVSWSPDGRLLATLADDYQTVIQIWDTTTWEEIHKFELEYPNPRRALNWSMDSKTLYEAGDVKGQMVVFSLSVTDGAVQEVGKFPVAQSAVFAISPDASKLAISDPRGIVQIIDIASGDVLTGMKTVNQPVDLAWNPNGKTLAILDYKTTLQLWEVAH